MKLMTSYIANISLFFVITAVGIVANKEAVGNELQQDNYDICKSSEIMGVKNNLVNGLRFFADYEGSPAAKYSYGDGRVTNPLKKFIYAPGISGQGLSISSHQGTPPQYHSAGNIVAKTGTIGFWFKHLMNTAPGDVKKNDWLFSSTGDKWRFYLYLLGSNIKFDYYITSGVPEPKTDSWKYISLRWSPEKISLLVNGATVKSSPVLSNWKQLWDIGKLFTVGGYNGGKPVGGVFDDFAIWDRYLDDNEIKTLYEMGTCHISFADKLPINNKGTTKSTLNKNDIIKNGSFEAGLNNMVMIEMPIPGSPSMPSFPVEANKNGYAVVNHSDAYHGKQSLELMIPPKPRDRDNGQFVQPNRGTARIQTLAFKLNKGTKYSVSFRIKVVKGDGIVADLGLDAIRSLGSPPAYFRKKVIIHTGSGKWKYVAVSGLPYDAYDGLFRLKIDINNTGTKYANVLIDAIQVVPASEINSTGSVLYKDTIAASLHTKKLANIFTEHDKAEFSISLSGLHKDFVKAGLVFDVYNLWGRKVLSKNIDVSIDGMDKAQFNIPVSTKDRGLFRATLSYRDTGYMLDETTFSVLPDEDHIPELAAHVSYDDYIMSVAKRMGIRWNRVWDNSRATTWPMIQPESPAEYRWDYSDMVINKYISNHFKLVGVISWPRSKWARNWIDNKRPHWLHTRWNNKDKNVIDYKLLYNDNFKKIWLRYASNVVSHYSGVIQYWELLNEPYQDGPASWVSDLYKDTVPVIRKANPEAKIVGPSIHDDIKWNKMLFATNILNYIDVFSYHGYYMDDDALRRMHTISESDNRRRLVFDTENSGISSGELFCGSCLGGVYTGSMSPAESAIRITKSLVQSLYSGTDKFFYYWMVRYDPYRSAGSFIDFSGKLTPAAVSYVEVSSMLKGMSHIGVTCAGNIGISCYVFKNNNTGQFVVALWENNDSVLPKPSVNIDNFPVAYDAVGGVVKLDDLSSPVYTVPGAPVFIFSDSRHDLLSILDLFGLSIVTH